MPKITIAPMSLPESITTMAYDTIINAHNRGQLLFLQTEKHPSAKWLAENHIEYKSFDSLYEQVDDFDELNNQIASALTCGQDVVYAVCGRGVASPLKICLDSLAKAKNIDVVTLPSVGYGECAAASCSFDLSYGCICAANSIPRNINVYVPLCVEEIDTRICAGEVKLALSEFYPENCDIVFAYTDENGKYSHRRIKLYELDRQTEYFATTLCLLYPTEFMQLERYGTEEVEEITRILRSPDGCPWDKKQTHVTLKTALIEEAYEVIDAIETDDPDALMEELGDVLLQIVFHAQIETEKSCFTMRDVCTTLVKKLIYRHPHVFANAENINTPDDVVIAWDKLKKVEKKQETQSDALRAVPNSFPALMRSCKVQKRASDVGFDWQCAEDAFPKIIEEANEVMEAMQLGDKEHTFEEIGDLLFSVVNVSRLLKIDPELALKSATDKFLQRFCKMEEAILKDGNHFESMTLEEMDKYWNRLKKVQDE